MLREGPNKPIIGRQKIALLLLGKRNVEAVVHSDPDCRSQGIGLGKQRQPRMKNWQRGEFTATDESSTYFIAGRRG